jgi:hypothetical protein
MLCCLASFEEHKWLVSRDFINVAHGCKLSPSFLSPLKGLDAGWPPDPSMLTSKPEQVRAGYRHLPCTICRVLAERTQHAHKALWSQLWLVLLRQKLLQQGCQLLALSESAIDTIS